MNKLCGYRLVKSFLSLHEKVHRFSRNFTQKSNAFPNETTTQQRTWLVGFGALGLSLGLIYNTVSKRNTLCKAEDLKNDANHILSNENKTIIGSITLKDAISQSQKLVERLKIELGLPGIVIGVSVDGEPIWSEGFGYSDIENSAPCHKDTVMRIASISKSFTMTAAAKLWEDGKLDLDKSIQFYLPNYPQPKFTDANVTITVRQLVSHMGGIRHYEKSPAEQDKKVKTDSGLEEFYSMQRYESVSDALKVFQHDSLLAKPGEKYIYTTYGYTLLSAVIESVANEPFHTHMLKMFKAMGLNNTLLDQNDVIIYNRSKFYFKKNGFLLNSPYVDNSNKWAGGGFVSNVGDLLKFGNIMLYSAQLNATSPTLRGYLKSNTVLSLWKPATEKPQNTEANYGMGWSVVTQLQEAALCRLRRQIIAHSGGAVGASSVLLILPRVCFDENKHAKLDCKWENPPSGVVVAILVNLQDVSLSKLASNIAEIFDKLDLKNK